MPPSIHSVSCALPGWLRPSLPALLCAALAMACTGEPALRGADAGGGEDAAPPLPADGGAHRADYPVEGVRLGQGWHSDFGERALADCVQFRVETDRGQEQSMRISVTHDHNEVMSSMEVSAEAQVKTINYQASGKASFGRQLRTGADSLSFIAYATVTNGARFAAPVDGEGERLTAIRLSPHFEALARRSRAAFRRQCGDGFVAAVFSGAELVAQLSFEETNSEKREALSAAMEGSGWGITASGEAASTLSEYAGSSRLSIRYFQSGGEGSPIPTDQDGFEAAIQRLPELAATAPHPYEILVVDYRTLANFPGTPDRAANDFHERLAVSYGRLLSLERELALILDDSDGAQWRWLMPPGETWQSLRRLQDELRDGRRALVDLADRCTFVPQPETPATRLVAPCAWSEAFDYRNDYALRIRLPIPSAAVSAALEGASQPEDCVAAQVAMVDRQREAMDGDPRNINRLIDAARTFRDLCVGVNPASYPELYTRGINEEIIRFRVLQVSDARCRDDVRDPGCLSSSAVDTYRQMLRERAESLASS